MREQSANHHELLRRYKEGNLNLPWANPVVRTASHVSCLQSYTSVEPWRRKMSFPATNRGKSSSLAPWIHLLHPRPDSAEFSSKASYLRRRQRPIGRTRGHPRAPPRAIGLVERPAGLARSQSGSPVLDDPGSPVLGGERRKIEVTNLKPAYGVFMV
ncbi:predicted protein [Histoplasma capsulatum H143]|uniref:Uncharacterized protein n=1 Tax=Ajellomyces capsulatus (strain H143) TaxID=544712 RepID=C6HCW8_AJECH|nr:predicted protein [Histoplasma capsulatum H143]